MAQKRRLGCGRSSSISVAVALALVCLGCVRAQEPAGPTALRARLPRIEANPNLSSAGQLRDGVFTVQLEIREGDWYPEGETVPSVVVQAFAEEGRALQIPGPLIRVPAGTEVRATVRNTLDKGSAKLYGLHGRPGEGKQPLEIPAGDIREVRFRLAAPGVYHYWATTTNRSMLTRGGVDSQLSGALIVDPPGEAEADRVFVMGLWVDRPLPGPSQPNGRLIAVINGKSWPYTERLTYDAGQPIRWHVINTSFFDHPMHLHGAYFRVSGEGNGEVSTALPLEKQRLVVTERFPQGDTRTIAPLLEREGRWLFHCHMLSHMSAEYRHIEPGGPGTFQPAAGVHHAALDSTGMAGLVLGITVRPATPTPQVVSSAPARQLRLLVRERPATDRVPGATVFQLQEGSQPPALDIATVPGPPLVLKQDEPVEITVVNQLREPTAIHWHGIELDSYYDGVPVWGGSREQMTPRIEPGQSFVARFAPPKAGTFIYHTHWHNFLQLVGGLYGPLIVLRAGQTFDPETDKVVMIGLGGSHDSASPLLLNGSTQPEPLRLKAGLRYRFRLINITPNNPTLLVSLLAGASPVRWRAVAKDGMDLPPAQALEQDARQIVSIGETFDFEFEPAAKGDLRLEVLRPVNRTLAVAEVQVR
jgi:FtsP/CotA-like multicopper oxidase with cupredoxin domain